MANTAPVYARIDTGLKENAEGILAQLGISPSEAISGSKPLFCSRHNKVRV